MRLYFHCSLRRANSVGEYLNLGPSPRSELGMREVPSVGASSLVVGLEGEVDEAMTLVVFLVSVVTVAVGEAVFLVSVVNEVALERV